MKLRRRERIFWFVQVQGLTEVLDIWKWEGLRRVSLMINKTEKVSEIPSSHDPLTLLLQHNYLEVINNDFFQSMHSLRVLNLSCNHSLTDNFKVSFPTYESCRMS